MQKAKKLPTSDKIIWAISIIVTLTLLTVLTHNFISIQRNYEPDREQLTSGAQVQEYINTQRSLNPQLKNFATVPTGMFLQSLNFKGPFEVHVSGYVWQNYKKGEHDGITRGFKFPESINAKVEKVYEKTKGDQTTIGWYFEASVLEHFDYAKYPLDNKVVWIRLWHADFDRNVILTPDLSSYDSTGKYDAFGLDEQIVLDGFKLHETFFDYRKLAYDTNFGLGDSVIKDKVPELYFNVSLKRDTFNGFMLHAMPALLVIFTAFALCLNINSDRSKAFSIESNIVSVISACSGLIFIIILINLNLRRGAIGGEFTFIECVYLLIISMIALIAFNALATAKPGSILSRALGVEYHNNIIIKALFLPVFLGGVLVLSKLILY